MLGASGYLQPLIFGEFENGRGEYPGISPGAPLCSVHCYLRETQRPARSATSARRRQVGRIAMHSYRVGQRDRRCCPTAVFWISSMDSHMAAPSRPVIEATHKLQCAIHSANRSRDSCE